MFARKNRLDMSLDLEWPSMEIKLKAVNGFRVWGNNAIGFGKPNGALALNKQLNAKLSGFPITIDGIGAGSSSGQYSFGTTGQVVMADDVSGSNGPPAANVYSIAANPYASKESSPAIVYESPKSSTSGGGAGSAAAETEEAPSFNTAALAENREAMIAGANAMVEQISTSGGEIKTYSGSQIALVPPAEMDPSVAQLFNLYNDFNQRQKAYFDSVMLALSDPVTAVINAQADALNKKITLKILALTDSINVKIDQQVTFVVENLRDRSLTMVSSENTVVYDQINSAAARIQLTLCKQLQAAVKKSVHENVTLPLTLHIKEELAKNAAVYIKNEMISVGVDVKGGEAHAEIKGKVGRKLEGLAKELLDNSIDFKKVGSGIVSLGNDLFRNIDTKLILDQLTGEVAVIVAKAAVEAAAGDALRDLSESIGVAIPMNFTGLGDKIRKGDLKGILSLDPVRISVKTKFVSFNGLVKHTADDPLFGTVWRGDIDFMVKVPQTFALDGVFINGRKGGSSYWFCQISPADGKEPTGGVLSRKARPLDNPVKMGPVQMVAASGRVYHHMRDDGKAVLPDTVMKYGAYMNFIFFDSKKNGGNLRLDVAAGIEMQLNGDYIVEFNGDMQGANPKPQILVVDTAAAVTGLLRLKYNSAEKHFLGYGAAAIERPKRLCASGSILVDVKPAAWRLALGSRNERLIFVPGCIGWSPTGWLDINETTAELGLGLMYSMHAEAAFDVGPIALGIGVEASVAAGIMAVVQYRPELALNEAGIWIDVYGRVYVVYKGPLIGEGNLTLVEIYCQGNLKVKFRPSPTTVSGNAILTQALKQPYKKMKKNCLYILSFLLLLMLQAEMLQGQQTPETEINESAEQEPMAQTTEEELQGWMSMAIAMAEHDPELKRELNAFNALPKEEKAKAFSLAGDLVNSVVVNKQVKNQLGVLADQDIVVLFKVDGVLLFSYIAEKLINREYREGKMVISVNHETGTEGIVNITADLEDADKDYVKALLEKYNLTAEQVVVIANGLISSKYQGGVQSFSLSTVAEKKAFVEEVIAAVVEGVVVESRQILIVEDYDLDEFLFDFNSTNGFGRITPSGSAIKLNDAKDYVYNRKGALISFTLKTGDVYKAMYRRPESGSERTFVGYFKESYLTSQVISGEYLTPEKLLQHRENRYSGFVFAAIGETIFGKAKTIVSGRPTDCKCDYTWTNQTKSVETEGMEPPVLMPAEAVKSNCTGGECLPENELKDGLGRDIYIALINDEEIKSDNGKIGKLIQLSNYLSDLLAGKSYRFYGNNLEYIGTSGASLPSDVIGFFKENKICNQEIFDVKFPKFNDKYNSSFDAEVILSPVNLWKEIPEDYNEYSIDWTSFKVPDVLSYEELYVYLEIIEETLEYYKTNQPGHIKPATEAAIQELVAMFRYTENLLETQKEFVPRAVRYMLVDLGFYAKYHYGFSDLAKREELRVMNGNGGAAQFYNVILTSEGTHKNAGPIALHSYHDQYVAQYGTESAFYLGEKYMTMMGLIYSLHALGVGTNMATSSLKAIPAYNQRMRLYNSRAKQVETQVKARMNETFLARYPAIRSALTSSRSEVGSNAKMYELDNFIRRLGKNELTKLEGKPELVSKLAQSHAKDPKLLANFRTIKGSFEEWMVKTEVELASNLARFYTSKEDYIAAISRGENVFFVGKHIDIKPRPTGPNGIAESHHGVNSVWMKAKYSDYSAENAPSVYMLKNPNHNATRGEFNKWAAEIRQRQGLSKVDYTKVTKDDILILAKRQFDVADVPEVVRAEYFKNWEIYIKTLTSK